MALCSAWSRYLLGSGLSLGDWLNFQWVAATAVLGPIKAHPYSSWPLLWPLNYQAIWYYCRGGARPEGILAMGHPLIWLGFLGAVAMLAKRWRQRRDFVTLFLMTWYLVSFLTLTMILWQRLDASFLFHMLPSTPPMMIALACAVTVSIKRQSWHVALCGSVVAVYLVFLPVIYALPASPHYFQVVGRVTSPPFCLEPFASEMGLTKRSPDLDAANDLVKRNQPEQAIPHLVAAINADHTAIDAYNQLAHLLIQAGRIDDAAAVLRGAGFAVNTSAALHNNLAEIAVRRRDESTALKEFEIARTLNPQDPVILLNRGAFHANRGRMEEARRDFEVGLRLAPDNRKIRDNLIAVLRALGQSDEAERLMRE